MPLTQGLIEVIVYVRDMARAVAFYRDGLGLRVTYPAGRADYGGEPWVTLDTGACVLALHAGGGEPGASPAKIVFGVADVHAARAALLAWGIRLGEVRPAAPGVWVCDGRDPDGNPFALEARA
ncbi:MAG: VOC family protein [Anaerolineales bacterium]|nr:VOC family protein [Anaerolineales bacterium]